MKNFFKKFLIISLTSFYFFSIEDVKSLIPYYYFPSEKNLTKEALSIGKSAFQLLYFGQYENSMNLAKLAIKINPNDEDLTSLMDFNIPLL